MILFCFFFFKQKTAYEMRISDWSSDVCSSDLPLGALHTDAIKQRVCNGPFSGFKCTAVTFGFAGAHHRLAYFPHDRTDVGEVEVDEARHNHQGSDTANILLQHFVSKLESLLEGGVGVGDKEKILIGNDNERVDMLLQLGNARVG